MKIKINKLHIVIAFLFMSMMTFAQASGGQVKRKSANNQRHSRGIGSSSKKKKSKEDNSCRAINLGLSVKWATCNVGAKVPWEYGDYFAWGEVDGYNVGKTTFYWSTYKWCNGNYDTFTKYCSESSCGIVDYKQTLENIDDVATAHMGSAWRMPTHDEQLELLYKCYWEWTYNYKNSNKSGYIVYKAKTDADKGKKKYRGSYATTTASYTTNDAHIFLPVAGFNGNRFPGSSGHYWSSSLWYESINAWCLYFGEEYVSADKGNRCSGLSVRAVAVE